MTSVQGIGGIFFKAQDGDGVKAARGEQAQRLLLQVGTVIRWHEPPDGV